MVLPLKQEGKNKKIAKTAEAFSTFFQRPFWCPLTEGEKSIENIKRERKGGANDNKLLKINIVTNDFTGQHLRKELRNGISNAGSYIFGTVMSNK